MSENSPDKKLSPRQIKAIEGLLTFRDMTAAADHAGVNPSTIYRWLREDEAFTQALKQAESVAISTLGRELITLGSKASKAVEAVLDDKESTAAQKLRAAEIILNNILKLRELADFEERLSRVEEKINNAQGEK